MKRIDAIEKLRTICDRLNHIDFTKFHLMPLQLFAFGSILTDKPNPNDLDLFLRHKLLDTYTPSLLIHDLSYGKPIPGEKASIELRRNMKMIRIVLLEINETIESWCKSHYMEHNSPKTKLVWDDNIDSEVAIQKIKEQPLKWDVKNESHNKYIQETIKKIENEEGESAAYKWYKSEILCSISP